MPIKKIAIIGTVGLPPRYGGFETFANQLIIYLSDKYKFLVFCSKTNYKLREKEYFSAERIFLPFKANGWQSVFYDTFSILYSLFKVDTLLILGVSGCILLPVIKPFHKKKIIVSIDGLDTQRAKWSRIAKIFLEISEYCAVKYSDNVISDNKIIKEYIKSKYNIDSKLITYGGDQSKKITVQPNDLIKYSFLNVNYALSIARIEKENHSELILKSFAQNCKMKLVYIGTWNHTKYSKYLYNKYKSFNNIILLKSIYDIYDLNLIRSNCTIFIHGNSAGGTNPGLLEAMHIGLPIIAYNVDFNRNVTENNALFFTTKDQLQNHIKTYTADKKLKSNNSLQVNRIAKEKYMWKDIAMQYAKIL